MKGELVNILPKFPQYEDIPYARDLECPNCGESGFYRYNNSQQHENPNLIGWCETNIGYMGIFECPVCHNKFRFHCTISNWVADIEEFDYYLFTYAERCNNWDEINKKLESK